MAHHKAIIGEPGHGKTLGLLKCFPRFPFIGPPHAADPLSTVFGVEANAKVARNISDIIAFLSGCISKHTQTTQVPGVILDDFSILSFNTITDMAAAGGGTWDNLAAYNNQVSALFALLDTCPFPVYFTGHYQPAKDFKTPEGRHISLPGSIHVPGWVVPTAFPSRIGTFVRTAEFSNPVGFRYGITQETPISVVKDRSNLLPLRGVVPHNLRELYRLSGTLVPFPKTLAWIDDYLNEGEQSLPTLGAEKTFDKLEEQFKDKPEKHLRLAESHLIDRIVLLNVRKEQKQKNSEDRARLKLN